MRSKEKRDNVKERQRRRFIIRRCLWPPLLLISAVIATRQWKSRPKDVAGLTPTDPPRQETTALRQRASKADKDNLLSPVKVTPSGSFMEFRDAVATYGHVEKSLLELNRFLAFQIRGTLSRAPKPLARRLRTFSVTTRERVRFLLEEVKSLANQAGILKKKRGALLELKNKVRKLIEVNQQQENCSSVLSCRLVNISGFSSVMHDVLWCLVRGVFLKRPVVVDSQPWRYDPYGWSRIFLPLTYKCPETPDRSSIWPGYRHDTKARGSILDIPDDIATELVGVHTDPYAWWFGQFMAYIMRPSLSLFDNLSETKRNITFRSPIVGLHIRRTDKCVEAARHEVEEYMEHAEEYFDNIAGPVPRRIYVATEDPSVFQELRKKATQLAHAIPASFGGRWQATHLSENAAVASRGLPRRLLGNPAFDKRPRGTSSLKSRHGSARAVCSPAQSVHGPLAAALTRTTALQRVKKDSESIPTSLFDCWGKICEIHDMETSVSFGD
ncbi:alpha-(1,6)-fucosyltransferase-like isoform X4 [Ornithodoros turicata]|uniref:alpha-(1,6)-fucosyltransferase-like isoform X4 n=1 Tax=Ornithodoros turicata TaxID=34597 RepID=UPI0031395DA8